MQRERPAPSLLQVVVIAALAFAVVAFLIIAFNTGDLLWFWPVFDGLPAAIVVHCYGQDVAVNPGDPAYTPVNTAVNDSLYGTKRWDSLSMSEVTYSEYQTSDVMMVIELSYDPPTRIHSFYKFFKHLDTLVIPLDGRHASSNSVFGRMRGYPVAGSLHVETVEPILTAVEAQGLCQKR